MQGSAGQSAGPNPQLVFLPACLHAAGWRRGARAAPPPMAGHVAKRAPDGASASDAPMQELRAALAIELKRLRAAQEGALRHHEREQERLAECGGRLAASGHTAAAADATDRPALFGRGGCASGDGRGDG